MKVNNIFIFLCIFVFFYESLGFCFDNNEKKENVKLYWFIPDGMRADPKVFNVFKWAQEGELPNIKWMMEHGSYGYSIPTFPSHTPTNFATLFTGRYPLKHGVADGPMHTEGNPLNRVSIGGFSSAAKKRAPIWVTLEKLYGKRIVLLSIPGSTPPELDMGITIRGRWGGWGADFYSLNFEPDYDNNMRYKRGRAAQLFFFGPPLTKYVGSKIVRDAPVISFSPVKEVRCDSFGAEIYAFIYDSTDDKKVNYDKVAFSTDKFNVVADLKQGEWSKWIPIITTWYVEDKDIPIKTAFKIKIIKLDEDGFFRIRLVFNTLNKYITKPGAVSEELIDNVGPMVDFVDNFPPQLIYYKEDKETFLEEAKMSFDWHHKAISFILDKYRPDIFINDIYTPNQMLTSRWWMGYIDPSSARYKDVSDTERRQLWKEVKQMYKYIDRMVGDLIKHADNNTYIVLSSDHGAVPLDRSVRLNNLFAKKGWLKFTIDPKTGIPKIDWEHSKVIYLKMMNVFISPKGLGGNWYRASGPEYEVLRREVKETLLNLKDPKTGIKPVIEAYNWEDVPHFLSLPIDRVGDLVIVNKAGYGWDEELTKDGEIFGIPLKTGYKQAILADREQGMWTPFIIVGPGVKKGYEIKQPIRHVDQYPTIMTLLGAKVDKDCDGRVLNEIFK